MRGRRDSNTPRRRGGGRQHRHAADGAGKAIAILGSLNNIKVRKRLSLCGVGGGA